MEKFEEFKKKVLAELDKLKGIDNEAVKTIYTNVTDLFGEVEDKKVEATKDDAKVEPKVEAKVEEPKVDDKVEAKVEEPKKEEAKVEEKVEDKVEDKIQLSAKVSDKLKEAAMELSRKDDVIATKDHILSEKDKQIVELSAELEKYKEAEQLELAKKLDEKVDSVIELFSNLGIQKSRDALTSVYNEEQLDKLAIDLSAMIPAKVANSKPMRSVPKQIELNSAREEKITDKSIYNDLFGED
jgi:hypothetical protein